MTRVLITGPTGNVGKSVMNSILTAECDELQLIAAARSESKVRDLFDVSRVEFRYFDFEDSQSFTEALEGIDIVFLLRPPQLADLKRYFNPFIQVAKVKEVSHIVFLSVQNADKIKFIPHYKIEQAIIGSGIRYTFIRPSYFIQNLFTTLLDDLKNGVIYLPAGNGLFNFIDVDDIGKCVASVITDTTKHIKKAYTLTGSENFSFQQIVDILNEQLALNLVYQSPNPISFLLKKSLQENLPKALVMLMLHYLPRFRGQPKISDDLIKIFNLEPNTLRAFIEQNKSIIKKNLATVGQPFS